MCQHLAFYCNKYPKNVFYKFAKKVANEEILDDDKNLFFIDLLKMLYNSIKKKLEIELLK